MIVLTETNFYGDEQRAMLFDYDDLKETGKIIRKAYQKFLDNQKQDEINEEESFCYNDCGHAKVLFKNGDAVEWQVITVVDNFD